MEIKLTQVLRSVLLLSLAKILLCLSIFYVEECKSFKTVCEVTVPTDDWKYWYMMWWRESNHIWDCKLKNMTGENAPPCRFYSIYVSSYFRCNNTICMHLLHSWLMEVTVITTSMIYLVLHCTLPRGPTVYTILS